MVKNLLASAGDASSIAGLGRVPGEGSGNPLQCSCLGNPKDTGALWDTVQQVSEELDLVTKQQQQIFLEYFVHNKVFTHAVGQRAKN